MSFTSFPIRTKYSFSLHNISTQTKRWINIMQQLTSHNLLRPTSNNIIQGFAHHIANTPQRLEQLTHLLQPKHHKTHSVSGDTDTNTLQQKLSAHIYHSAEQLAKYGFKHYFNAMINAYISDTYSLMPYRKFLSTTQRATLPLPSILHAITYTTLYAANHFEC